MEYTRRNITATFVALIVILTGFRFVQAQFISPTCVPPNCNPQVIQNIPLIDPAQTADFNITGDGGIGTELQVGGQAPVLTAGTENLIYGNVGATSTAGSLLLLQNGSVDRFKVDIRGDQTLAGDLDVQGGDITSTTGPLNLTSANDTDVTISAPGTGDVVFGVGDNLTVQGDLNVSGTITGDGSGITGLAESDTLATVVARGSNTSGAITVSGNLSFDAVDRTITRDSEAVLGMYATETVVNDGGVDQDLRVEGLGAPNALFVQGSDGYVGIGTNVPLSPMQVCGTGFTCSYFLYGATGDWYLRPGNSASGKIILADIGGDVGIGTSSPSAKLDVVGNAEVNGDLTVTGSIIGTVTETDTLQSVIDRGRTSTTTIAVGSGAAAFDSTGVNARATNTGLRGIGTTAGSTGVYGNGWSIGVHGQSGVGGTSVKGDGDIGVWGQSNTGNYGGYFSSTGYAVFAAGDIRSTGDGSLVGSLAVGGTGAFTGNVTVAGQSVCRADGTNCPSGAVSSVSGSGAGVSVSPTTGAVVVQNTGVTSAVAGAGISLSGGTGAVTITNTGDTNAADDITGLNAGAGISVTSIGQVYTVTNTGDTNAADDITGSGATNYVPKFTSGSAIGISNIYIDGTNVGIGTVAMVAKLDVLGSVNVTSGYEQGGDVILSTDSANGTLLGGVGAGSSLSSGINNTFLGQNAGNATTTASDNSFIGFLSGSSNTTGVQNTAMGSGALLSNVSGFNNIAVGFQSLYNNTASNNTALGAYALRANTSGTANTAVGEEALLNNSTGINNTATGLRALYSSTTGNDNTVQGYRAGFGLTTGSNNVFLGWQAGDVTTTGTGNIVIGYNIDATSAIASNELNIGNTIYGQLSLGRVGINDSTPSYSLDVNGTARFTSGIGSGGLTPSSSYGIRAQGDFMGGFFKDSNSSGYANVGNGDYGIQAYGNTAGGYFYDTDGTSWAYLGYFGYGIYTAYQGYFGGFVGIGDSTPSYALDVNGYGRFVNGIGAGGITPNSQYGIRAQGTYSGGWFKDTTSGIYARIGYSSYGIFTNGGAYIAGTCSGGSSCNQDVAEYIRTEDNVEPGDVVEIGVGGRLRKSTKPYSTKVAGLISTNPAIIFPGDGDEKVGNKQPLALAGVAPVKVTDENGKVNPGDLLTSSSTPGHAMKCIDKLKCIGSVIGKALEGMDGSSDVIRAVVTLQ